MRRILFLAILGAFLAACGGDATEETVAETVTGDGGIDELTTRITEQPQNPSLYAARAELFYEKNNFDQAINDMTVAMTLDSTNLDYHHLLSDIYLDYFRSRLALQTMERAVALYPEDIPSLLKLSELQLFLKQNSASLQTIDKVLRLQAQHPLAFFFMGKNFEEMGDINRAINSFQESVEIDPEMVDAWVKLGQLHGSIDGSLAIDFFNNAIEVDSNNTIALSAKAEYLWDQDDLAGALATYKDAIRKAPLDEKGYYNAGLVLMEMDSVETAFQHFNMAVENSPLHVGAYFFRGYSAELLGRTEEARRDYEYALRLSPDYEDAQEGLARVSGQ